MFLLMCLMIYNEIFGVYSEVLWLEYLIQVD